MTEQQQKLYDKLLKKVNEYCLGAAAEDVIAAIDALVETYEPVQEGKPKYIRTKDGQIIDINRTVRTNNILKKAATIEELCDEFVYVNKVEGLTDKTHTISFDMPNHQFTEPTVAKKMEYIRKRYKDDLDKIKLGIWTDKGLIYVAKMNDEGELELL